jgi:hypothetical protein
VAWAEHAIRDLNELSRQSALLLGDDGHQTEDDTPRLVRASLLASNIVHQLRATLDNLVWQLSWLNRQEPGSQNSFPLRDNDNAQTRRRIGEKLAGLKQEHIDAIKLCQPYHDPDGHPLKRLEDLWTADKHNVLSVVEFAAAPVIFAGVPMVVPGGGLAYEDGTFAVPALRQSLGAVNIVVSAFVPALDGRPVDLQFAPHNVADRAEYFRWRDPSATYLDDLNYVAAWAGSITDFPSLQVDVLSPVLAAAKRLLDSPVREFHERWLVPVEEKLTKRLEELEESEQ